MNEDVAGGSTLVLPDSEDLRAGGFREWIAVLSAFALAMAALTFPFAAQMSHVGRVDNGDGRFSIWNVAWVARTLPLHPWRVYDANIFYPHRWTLAYSESNIGAGILAIPVYWATHNPYLSLNVVVLLAFALSGCGTYYLVRYLTGDRTASALSAVCFAFCPYVFAHLSHIQLLMTAGLPFSMLALHRLVDRPGAVRAITLGAAIAAQAACCGYYAVFVMLMVGAAVLTIATMRRRWGSGAYWAAVGGAALAAVAFTGPLFVPYLLLQRTTGFTRPLDDAVRYSANWSAYLASSAVGHTWLLPLIRQWIGQWNEVLFPGFVSTGVGLAGAIVGWRSGGRLREIASLYGMLGLTAFWASFGPDGGLYTALYHVIPLFAWLRAPSRFGLVVALALAVLAGVGVSALLRRVRRGRALLGMAIVVVAAAELATPLHLREVEPVAPASRMLAGLPPGPVIELPYFFRHSELHGHAAYMLESTAHWMPLINGYSDYIPPDFSEDAETLHLFPSAEAFRLLESRHPKYAMYHMEVYGEQDRADMTARLREFSRYLRPLYVDGKTDLYEIVGFPP